MGKNGERVAKKRGRPRKFKKLQVREESADDELLTKSSNGDGDELLTKSSNALIQPSHPLGDASSTDITSVKISKYRTRQAQAVADKQAVVLKRLNAKNTVAMEFSSSKSPVEAQDLSSQHEIISPSKSIDAPDGTTISSETDPLNHCKNVLDLDKLTSDILAQAHEKNNELISDHIDVDGYKVKRESAPLLEAIFRKYGNICKECILSVESRSILLEWVCSIYKKLEASTFLQLPSSELKTMLGQAKDLELLKMEIGWLSERLSQISKARETYGGVSTIDDYEARTEVVIGEMTKAVEIYEKKVKAEIDAVKKLQEKLQQEKEELVMLEEIKKMCGESLVNGLV